MNKADLIALRKDGTRDFPKIGIMHDFLVDLLGNDLVLPVVIGYHQGLRNPEKLEIKELKPLTKTTQLTLENYLEGIRKTAEEYTHTFLGEIQYPGLQTFERKELGNLILSCRVSETASKGQTFYLQIFLGHERDKKTDNFEVGYSAESDIPSTLFDRQFRRFVGPNTPGTTS